MRTQLSLAFLLATFAPLAACDAQLRAAVSWPAGDAWITSVKASCGQVRGRVIRWPTGFQGDTVPGPLVGAFVQLVDSATQPYQGLTRTTASTNAAGEFQLALDKKPTGFATLLIQVLGYERVVVALNPSHYQAYVVEIGLRSMGLDDPQLGLSVQAVRGISPCEP